MPLGRVSVLVLSAPLAVAVAGCGSPESEAASAAAVRFVEAVPEDPDAACDLLAPPTVEKTAEEGGGDCAAGLQSAGLSLGSPAASELSAEVAGHTARVTVGRQTVFLSLFDDGWKVLAAGCERRSDDQAEPYDCAVQGD